MLYLAQLLDAFLECIITTCLISCPDDAGMSEAGGGSGPADVADIAIGGGEAPACRADVDSVTSSTSPGRGTMAGWN